MALLPISHYISVRTLRSWLRKHSKSLCQNIDVADRDSGNCAPVESNTRTGSEGSIHLPVIAI
ncbi:hypothetical protein J6590_085638 [Homalodisca vitripennis]|nr:hypothetical protein J6590_085638 [Homalodisca vitripennis]